MKKLAFLTVLFFSISSFSADMGYPSFRGWLDEGRSPEKPESPLHKVKDTTAFPFRTIGRIGTGCTATLISSNEILTAAHCVYSLKDNEFYQELEFSPAQNGKFYPFGTIEWDRVRAPTEWTDEHNDDFDFALITLKENIGESLGWLGMKVEKSPNKKPIQISGYAGEKKFGTLWHSKCKLSPPTPFWLNYECETQGGMSGSAVVLLDESETNHQVIGIHALGGEIYNSGVRITPTVYKMILSWK